MGMTKKMNPETAEVLAELPEELRGPASSERDLAELIATLAKKPVPTSRVLRMWCLGTLQARIAVAYLVSWIRGGFAGAEEKARLRNEAHLRAAVKLLGSMGYMRGAVMKAGQLLANYPQVVPAELVDTLKALHFEAPPMHYSLLREHVRNELGADPEELFAEFETEALAAASLGQVHRARLKSGEVVAVKIQYPNIARTIRADFANLRALLLPMRLTEDWDNFVDTAGEIERMLLREADYRTEIENAEKVRAVLDGMEGVVVPRMFPELSSSRVLTMELVPGVHVEEFMEQHPSQELRDRYGELIMRTGCRLFIGGQMFSADPNPGNFLFLADGRLGLIDFGCLREFSDEETDFFRAGARANRVGGDAWREAIQRGSLLSDEEMKNEARYALALASVRWLMEPLQRDEPFDFGDEDYLRRGLESMGELIRRRYTRSMPIFVWMNRTFYGLRAICYSLRARVNLWRIDDEETKRAGIEPA